MGANGPLRSENRANPSPSVIFAPEISTVGYPLRSLAAQGSGAHDSGSGQITDNWPLAVPITAEEVDVIESFLKREIDVLLR